MKIFTALREDLVEISLSVSNSDNNLRLDQFIQRYFSRLSRQRIQAIIKEKVIDQNGFKTKPSRRVRPGDVFFWKKSVTPEDDYEFELDILNDDENLLAINKPSGLLVHPSAKISKKTVTAWLLKNNPTAKIAHRLDRETSGVLLCGKNQYCNKLKAYFKAGKIQKTYLAIAKGRASFIQKTVSLPLMLDQRSSLKVKMCVDENFGVESITHMQTIATSDNYSLIRCEPKTGRQHQIRVHLHALGHPLLGDKLYGVDETIFRESADSGMTERVLEATGAARHLLHAAEIHFTDDSGRIYHITAPIPEDMAALIKEMSPV